MAVLLKTCGGAPDGYFVPRGSDPVSPEAALCPGSGQGVTPVDQLRKG
jgi:hypothetical protein